METTQLLCTFTTFDKLDESIQFISSSYNIAFDSIYVLQNTEDPLSLCCTYNIFVNEISDVPPFTISLHRKKSTNTLYTINALNLLIESLNNGKLDKNFPIPWEDYSNTVMVVAYNELKLIHTKLIKIIRL
jgi:hypothetical protein